MLAEANNNFDLKTERMLELASLAKDKEHSAYPITTFGTPRDPNAIATLAASGVNRCIFGLKAASAEEVLPRLDKIAKFVETLT